MKKDLTTAIIASVIGIVASYFVVNLLFGEIEDFTISTVDPNLNINLSEPSSEVFNYLAVNPTVEVYVGECTEYDQNGECLDEAKDDNQEEYNSNTKSDEESDKEKTDTEDEETEKEEETEETEAEKDNTNEEVKEDF